eukprot:16266920-Heterocapsa_arctica.AAC.1
MRGIKYPPLSGPGPSGFRPEFITDLMTVRKKMRLQKAQEDACHFLPKSRKRGITRQNEVDPGIGRDVPWKTRQNYRKTH